MHDLLIVGGLVVDGTSTEGRGADVAVDAGEITAMGDLSDRTAASTIDATGKVVSPGFIDMHVHADLQIFADPAWRPGIAQGVTTLVIGHDGLGLAPMDERAAAYYQKSLAALNGTLGLEWIWSTVDEYLDAVERRGPTPNIAFLASHGTIRLTTMGIENRPPTLAELDAMTGAVGESLDQGAFGLSSGLTYVPGMFADDDELVHLCAAAATRGGFYAPHHRSYGVAALEEYGACIEISRRSGYPLHLTHANIVFDINRGRAGELLGLVDAALADGLDVTMDSYPYTAGATYLHAFLPSWTMNGGGPLEALSAKVSRRRIRQALEVDGSDGFHGLTIDWSVMVVSSLGRTGRDDVVGLSIAEIGRRTDTDPFDVFADLLLAEELDVSCIAHIMDEVDVSSVMQHSNHMASSDGIVVGQRPHPRAWGTFARYLGRYVRELDLVPLHEMVRKMTALPASRLGLNDRGLLQPGFAADIVVFDPSTVCDTATYEQPRSSPVGVHHVFVNGEHVVRDGEIFASPSGRVLRRAA